MKQFYERLKELRNEKKLSQKALSELIFVSQQTVAKWEKNNSTPNPDALIKICQVLDCSSDYLLGISETKKAPLQMQESLTADEQKLLNYFKELNDEGQYLLINQAQALVTSGLYIKNKESKIHSENLA